MSTKIRLKRIGRRTVQEVNQLIKQYFALQKMMKKMGKMKLPAGLNYPIMGAH